MKRPLLLVILACSIAAAHAQKLELSVQANTNVSHFTGISAADNSIFYASYGFPENSYTDHPYGKKYAWGFGGGLQLQWVAKSGFIVGLATGYEQLKSKVNINGIGDADPVPLGPVPAVIYLPYGNVQAQPGSATYLQSTFINLSPYIGYRIGLKKVNVDLLPGMDVAFMHTLKEKGGPYDNSGKLYPAEHVYPKMPTDVRLKIGANINYQRYSINAGYAHGITNYDKDMTGGGSPKAQMELFRLGIGYRLL